MPHPQGIVLILGFGLALAGPIWAQSTVALSKPDAEFPEPFTRISGIEELANGKVLTTDVQDKLIQLIDFGTGTAVKVGREGQGPGEYGLPGNLYRVAPSQIWLQDLLNRRFLVIEQDGKVVNTVPLPTMAGRGPGGMIFGGPGGGADGEGRLYFQAPPFELHNDAPKPVDSMAILRWDRVEPTMDTVAWIRAQKDAVSASGGSGRMQVRIGGGKVFSPEEAWGVAADGSVARVVPEPFQVIWYGPNGAVTAGRPVPYTPIKVTDADKQRVIEQRKKMRPVVVAMGRGGRAMRPPNIELPEPEFEETKPPFAGREGVIVAPAGEVWVLRSRPAGDRTPVYDVFDRTGKVVRKVSLGSASRVVGFGKGTVYVARTDEEDLEYLQRFKR